MVFITCATDPDHIGYAQLCDPTMQARGDNYADEAVFERMFPGEGELPLGDLLRAFSNIVANPKYPDDHQRWLV